MIVLLAFVVGLCLWVGRAFRDNTFSHVWPIQVSRHAPGSGSGSGSSRFNHTCLLCWRSNRRLDRGAAQRHLCSSRAAGCERTHVNWPWRACVDPTFPRTQVLRVFGQIFFQLLDVATMSLLLIAMDCSYFSVPQGREGYIEVSDARAWLLAATTPSRFQLEPLALWLPCGTEPQEFPDVYCWSMPHLIHLTVAAVSLIVFW